MADEDIVVEIESEPKPAGTETVTLKEDDPLLVELREQKKVLEADAERERQTRQAAEQRAQREQEARVAAEQKVETVQKEVADSRLGTVEQGLAAAQTEAEAAQAEYVSAQEAGDWKRASDAQRKMARAEARIVRLDEAKSDLEAAAKAPVRTETRQETRQETQPDQVEAFIASRDKPTQAWLRNHMDDARVLATNSDPRRAAKLTAADNEAFAEGLTRGSPEYFAHVETYLGMTKAAAATNGANNGAQRQQQRRASSAPVAPVSQSGGSAVNGGGSNEVRLSAGEAKAATDGTLVWNYDDPSGQKRFKKGDVIGVQEFARRKKAMHESGQYDKTYYES